MFPERNLHINRSNDRVCISFDGLEEPVFLSLEDAETVAMFAADIKDRPAPKFPPPTGPQVVVHIGDEGTVYVEHYDLDHYLKVESDFTGNRRTLESLHAKCELDEAEYIVIPLKEEPKPAAKRTKKPVRKVRGK